MKLLHVTCREHEFAGCLLAVREIFLHALLGEMYYMVFYSINATLESDFLYFIVK